MQMGQYIAIIKKDGLFHLFFILPIDNYIFCCYNTHSKREVVYVSTERSLKDGDSSKYKRDVI